MTMAPADVVDVLREAYGIDAVRIEPRDGGAVSEAYVVTTRDGERLWVKLWSGRPSDTAASVAVRTSSLRIVEAVGRAGVDVAPARPAGDGALSVRHGAMELAVFDYLDGHRFAGTPAESALLGAATAAIHRATDRHGDVTLTDFYRIDIDLELLAQMAPDMVEETAAVVARRADLEAAFADRTAARRKVLCHTDLTPWNLIVRTDGRLFVLDWDEASLAWPEQDFMFPLWSDVLTYDPAAFWHGYRDAGGDQAPDFDVLEWVLLGRTVDDMRFELAAADDPDAPDARRASARGNLALGRGEFRRIRARMAVARTAFRP
jgi:Ser/Thr protein kinase RdoA (MazF antagonist)